MSHLFDEEIQETHDYQVVELILEKFGPHRSLLHHILDYYCGLWNAQFFIKLSENLQQIILEYPPWLRYKHVSGRSMRSNVRIVGFKTSPHRICASDGFAVHTFAIEELNELKINQEKPPYYDCFFEGLWSPAAFPLQKCPLLKPWLPSIKFFRYENIDLERYMRTLFLPEDHSIPKGRAMMVERKLTALKS